MKKRDCGGAWLSLLELTIKQNQGGVGRIHTRDFGLAGIP